MKRVADSREPVVGIPLILEPVQVQVAPARAAPEFGRVAVAVRVPKDRTNIQNTVYATTP